MSPPEALTDDQAAVYDRQLRVWGLEVQQRLTSAKILIIGGDGLAAEIAKNLVLAGVGHLAIADDTPCSQAPSGNFLVPSDAADPTTVAEASVRTLSAMNPLVSVSVQPLAACTPQMQLTVQSSLVAPYDLIISCCGLSSASADNLEEICAVSHKKLYISEVFGSQAYAYVNLGESHTYSEKKPDAGAAGQPAALKQACYPRLAAALSRPVKQCLGRRPVPSLYQVLRVMRKFESVHGRPAASQEDLPALQALSSEVEVAEGGTPGCIPHQDLSSWVTDRGVDHHLGSAPVSAVMGGVLANSVIRAVSCVGAPLKNWAFFSLADGKVVVEDIDGPLPA